MQNLDWVNNKKILVILAHPDDPEFFLGATLASWTAAGHTVEYALLTHGENGVSPEHSEPKALARLRESEQQEAAAVLGVRDITWLDYPDGYLVPTLDSRKRLVALIRAKKPDIVVSCDPTNYYMHGTYLNHPDHRAAGQMVVDAVFPAVGNPAFFPELLEEGLTPHAVSELWLSLPAKPNFQLDVTSYWERRTQALLCHASQIGEPQEFLAHQEQRRIENQTPDGRYCEAFQRIQFRK